MILTRGGEKKAPGRQSSLRRYEPEETRETNNDGVTTTLPKKEVAIFEEHCGW
jgi:hypothetical protein